MHHSESIPSVSHDGIPHLGRTQILPLIPQRRDTTLTLRAIRATNTPGGTLIVAQALPADIVPVAKAHPDDTAPIAQALAVDAAPVMQALPDDAAPIVQAHPDDTALIAQALADDAASVTQALPDDAPTLAHCHHHQHPQLLPHLRNRPCSLHHRYSHLSPRPDPPRPQTVQQLAPAIALSSPH